VIESDAVCHGFWVAMLKVALALCAECYSTGSMGFEVSVTLVVMVTTEFVRLVAMENK
jgi:hypothetical protein